MALILFFPNFSNPPFVTVPVEIVSLNTAPTPVHGVAVRRGRACSRSGNRVGGGRRGPASALGGLERQAGIEEEALLAFEGDSRVVGFQGNYQDYEADRPLTG
jgi:hypothetical protein